MDLGGRPTTYIVDGRFIFPDYDEKCAASAAHFYGKQYLSSETFTCMGPVLNTPLQLCKEKLDYDFFAGVNHTCFHGIAYSPASARWPGWLFYAGTHLGEFNPQWAQIGQLNTYITRCQSFLQKGRHDCDLLFYLPYYDIFSRIDSDPGKAPRWWGNLAPENYPTAGTLTKNGCHFDFFSDKMLAESIRTEHGQLVTPGNRYRAIVIADCQRIPVATLQKVLRLAEQATVLMIGALPSDVPGLNRMAERQEEFSRLIKNLKKKPGLSAMTSAWPHRSGRVVFGKNVNKVIAYAGISRETMTDDGLEFTRRRDDDGWIYFIANPAAGKVVEQWITLGMNGRSAALFDPMTGESGRATFRTAGGGSSVYLQLKPRESIIVKVFDNQIGGSDWNYKTPAGDPVILSGNWKITFLSGGEILPHPEEISRLSSWTDWQSDQRHVLKGFAGVARYSITFTGPSVKADDYYISLGEVYHTARVTLNGKLLGDVFSAPKKVLCGNALQPGTNMLEIEVANTPINRTADLDIKGIEWYYRTPGMDLSSCDWDNTKKDSTWVPQPSGLLGPIELIPVRFQGMKKQ